MVRGVTRLEAAGDECSSSGHRRRPPRHLGVALFTNVRTLTAKRRFLPEPERCWNQPASCQSETDPGQWKVLQRCVNSELSQPTARIDSHTAPDHEPWMLRAFLREAETPQALGLKRMAASVAESRGLAPAATDLLDQDLGSDGELVQQSTRSSSLATPADRLTFRFLSGIPVRRGLRLRLTMRPSASRRREQRPGLWIDDQRCILGGRVTRPIPSIPDNRSPSCCQSSMRDVFLLQTRSRFQVCEWSPGQGTRSRSPESRL